TALRRPVGVGVTRGIGAAAVFLLVELLALADLDHALRAALLAPVVLPVDEAGIARGRPHAAVVDLGHVLPARDAQRAGDHGEAVLVGVQRRALEAHVEAHRAAHAPLRLVLHAARPREPFFLVVVRVDELDAVLFRERDVLALADLVLRARMDVGVVEEDRVLDARFEHRFHDLAGTGRAAGMQQHPGAGGRRFERLALGKGRAVAHFTLEDGAGRDGRRQQPKLYAGAPGRDSRAGTPRPASGACDPMPARARLSGDRDDREAGPCAVPR